MFFSPLGVTFCAVWKKSEEKDKKRDRQVRTTNVTCGVFVHAWCVCVYLRVSISVSVCIHLEFDSAREPPCCENQSMPDMSLVLQQSTTNSCTSPAKIQETIISRVLVAEGSPGEHHCDEALLVFATQCECVRAMWSGWKQTNKHG